MCCFSEAINRDDEAIEHRTGGPGLRRLGDAGSAEVIVRVRVPASTANLGPAFDVLGVALTLHNEVELEPGEATTVVVRGEGEGTLPPTAANLVARAAGGVARAAGVARQFSIRCRNRIPLGRGLGSSAAAIVGGAVAANEALGRPLSTGALLELAWKMEGHPDNVAAALLGGVVLVDVSSGSVAWTRLLPRWELEFVVAVPEFSVATGAARAALPAAVPLRDAVANLARTARLVAAFATGQPELLRGAFDDTLHQPYRSALVPGMQAVIRAANEAGAYGAALSGSGPTVVALAPAGGGEAVGRAMVEAFAAAGQTAAAKVLQIDDAGATVVDRETPMRLGEGGDGGTAPAMS
ncbi:MAG: homoserine kinase [Armatimonadota bacterium]|nr:homoserine kinase [Armatimonadota bacterium]MDR7451183.1 homoserine kinase [Armatimonadota bacterium]MDR7467212.1 homoserine kinase [Armatimonadota bacterium]MDR7494860.1 homoserine kinase [Armatimonadota bacterium]MDR7500064.1 homoserine kinase [Armatimonadota bacterium]